MQRIRKQQEIIVHLPAHGPVSFCLVTFMNN